MVVITGGCGRSFHGEIHAEKFILSEFGLFVGKVFATHAEIAGQFNGSCLRHVKRWSEC